MFRSLIPASVVLVAVVAACSGPAATTAPTVAPATASAAPATPAPTLAFTVALAPAGFFVGPSGLTLYTFDNDTPGTSNCTSGQCFDNWPPLALASGTELATGAGLPASDFSTITWDDGTTQVTFKDIPLYYFAGDAAVGDTNGDGVGGVWHLATKQSTLPLASTEPSTAPSTEPSTAPSSAPSSAPSTAPSPAASAMICHDEYDYEVPCPSDAAGGATVALSDEGYLVNSAGLSLYTFDNDTTENTSACTGECLTNWPAVTIATGQAVSAGEGLELDDFTTFTRTDDDATQVAYNAKPLYTFAGDAAPGDTNGDGVGDVWHLAMPATVSVSDEGNIVNSDGWSLYTFDNDTTANASSCTGECLVNWPALTIETGQAVSAGEGLELEDFTTFTRTDDDTTQVAYLTKPLYTFAGDAAAGDTNGDGVGGIWHLAKPQE